MNIKKGDFIKNLKEAIIQPLGDGEKSGDKNPFATVADPKQIDNIEKNVTDLEALKGRLEKLGMVQEEIDEALDMGKEYESKTEFYKDMIDHLMFKNYRVSYFNPVEPEVRMLQPEKPKEPASSQLSLFPKKDKSELPKEELVKPISQMSSEEYNQFTQERSSYGNNNLFYIISRIKAAEEKVKNGEASNSTVDNPFRVPYIALQDTGRMMREVEINEEKFVNSNIFRIIAESETPKITKEEILEFFKNK
jgi:hypothetical protein